MRCRVLAVITVLVLSFSVGPAYGQVRDSDRLGMALEYFQSGKYHECMLLLEKLDSQYRLNPRFRAYLGVCYFHEWDYARCAACIDSVLPDLAGLAPQELSVYYWADGESHFNLGEYRKAIPLYERMLLVCHDNERGDAYYRMGFCYMYEKEWQNARECFEGALAYYERFRTGDRKARIAQVSNMIEGLKKKAGETD